MALEVFLVTDTAQICQYVFLAIGYFVTFCNCYYAFNLIRRVSILYNYMLSSVLITWLAALVSLTVHTRYSLFFVELLPETQHLLSLEGATEYIVSSFNTADPDAKLIRVPLTAIQSIPCISPFYYIRQVSYTSIMIFSVSYKLSLMIFILLYFHRFKCIKMIKNYPRIYDIIVYILTWVISILGLVLTLVCVHKVPFSQAWQNDDISEVATAFSLTTIAWSCLWDTVIPLVFLTVVYKRQKNLEQMQGYGFETTFVTPVVQRWLVLMLTMIIASTWTGFFAHVFVYFVFKSSDSYEIVLRLWACLHTFEFSGSLVFMALAKKIMSYRHVIRSVKQGDPNPVSMMSEYEYLSDVDISYI